MPEKTIVIRMDTGAVAVGTTIVKKKLEEISRAVKPVGNISIKIDPSTSANLRQVGEQAKGIANLRKQIDALSRSMKTLSASSVGVISPLNSVLNAASVSRSISSVVPRALTSPTVSFDDRESIKRSSFADFGLSTPVTPQMIQINDAYASSLERTKKFLDVNNSSIRTSVNSVNTLAGSMKNLTTITGMYGKLDIGASRVGIGNARVNRPGDNSPQLLDKNQPYFFTSGSGGLGGGGGSVSDSVSKVSPALSKVTQQVTDNARTWSISSRAISAWGNNASATMNKVATSTKHITDSFFNFQNLMMAMGVGVFIRQLVETTVEVQRFSNAFTVATGSVVGANKEIEYAIDISKRYGLNLRSTADQLSQLEVAAKGTSLEGKGVRDVFEAISASSMAMGLSSDRLSRSLYAVQQMITKGRVSTEELNRQWGENFPGISQMAAKALGMTTQELYKQMSVGKIYAENLLPKLAVELNKTFSGALPAAVKSFIAEMNRFSTSLFTVQRTVAESGFTDSYAKMIGAISRAMDDFVSSGNAAAFGQQISNIISYGTGMFKTWMGVPDLLDKNTDSFYKTTRAVEGLAVALTSLAVLGGGARVLGALSTFLGSGPVGILVGAFALLGAAIFTFRDQLSGMTEVGKFNAQIKEMGVLIKNVEGTAPGLVSTIGELSSVTYKTVSENKKLNQAFSDLTILVPSLTTSMEALKKGEMSYTDFVKQGTAAIKERTAALDLQNAKMRESLATEKLVEAKKTKSLPTAPTVAFGSFGGKSAPSEGIMGLFFGSAHSTEMSDLDFEGNNSIARRYRLDKERGVINAERALKEAQDAVTSAQNRIGFLNQTGITVSDFDENAKKMKASGYSPTVAATPTPEEDNTESIKKAGNTYRDFLRTMVKSQYDAEGQMAALQVDGIEQRIKQAEYEHNSRLLELDYSLKEAVSAEGLSQQQINDMVASANKTRLLETQAYYKDVARMRADFQTETENALKEEAEQLKEQFDPMLVLSKQMESYNFFLKEGLIPQDIYDQAVDAAERNAKDRIKALLPVDELEEKIKQYRQQLDPAYSLSVGMADLNEVKSGIPEDSYRYGKKQVEDQSMQMQIDMLLEIGSAWDGARVAMHEYYTVSQEYARNTYEVWQTAISGMEDLFTDLLTGQKVNFMSFIQELISATMRYAVIRPLMGQLFNVGWGAVTAGAGSIGGAAGIAGDMTGAFNMGALAVGGPAQANTPYIVGEKGMELFVPSTAGSVVPNDVFTRMLDTSSVINNNNIMENARPVGQRAYGGPTSANTPYIVGERGVELFVPSTAGSIVPNGVLKDRESKGNKTTISVPMTVHINGGDQNTTRNIKNTLRREGTRLARTIKEGMRDQ